LWRESAAFFANDSEYRYIVELLRDKSFYGRWFYYGNSVYSVYAHEYAWSQSYQDEFDDWIKVKVDTGTTRRRTKKLPQRPISILRYFENLNNESDGEVVDSLEERVQHIETGSVYEEREVEEKVYESIAVMPSWNHYSWSEEYDMSKDESVDYGMPCGRIINDLNLQQLSDGMWYRGDELVCFDLSLIKGNNSEGLYIRKDMLEKFMEENNLKIIWVGLGEKSDRNRDENVYSSKNSMSELSTFVYHDESGNLRFSHIIT
jgi:hypothetical protein